jgi:undecaprenyl-diphosphatase
MSLTSKKILSIILILLFLIITLCIITDYQPLISIDKTIKTFSSTLHSPTLDQTMLSITKIGNTYESLLIFVVFSLFLISKRKKDTFYVLAIVTGLGAILPEIIKIIIERIRPMSNLLLETSYSFPSGHATLSTVFLLSSIFLISPTIKNNFSRIVFIICTSIIFPLVALSRIYLSVHWTSDVLGGVLLGSICYLLVSIFCCHKKENML